jgi:hypothetical protein
MTTSAALVAATTGGRLKIGGEEEAGKQRVRGVGAVA